MDFVLHSVRVWIVCSTSVGTLQTLGVPLETRLAHQFFHCITALIASKKLRLPNTRSVANVVAHVLGCSTRIVKVAYTHATERRAPAHARLMSQTDFTVVRTQMKCRLPWREGGWKWRGNGRQWPQQFSNGRAAAVHAASSSNQAAAAAAASKQASKQTRRRKQQQQQQCNSAAAACRWGRIEAFDVRKKRVAGVPEFSEFRSLLSVAVAAQSHVPVSDPSPVSMECS